MAAVSRWLGPMLAAAGVGIYVWYTYAPATRGVIGFAVIAGVQAYHLSLPLVGAGLLLARLDRRAAAAGYLAFFVALVGSVWKGGWLADWFWVTSGATKIFGLAGPTLAVFIGLALLLPSAFRLFLAPVASTLAGFVLGMSIRVFDPTAGDPNFALAMAIVALWLVTTPLLVGRLLKGPSFEIATRIAGSWLIAIGMLLGAVRLLPAKERTAPTGMSEIGTYAGFLADEVITIRAALAFFDPEAISLQADRCSGAHG